MNYNRMLIEELKKAFDNREKYLIMNQPEHYEVKLEEDKTLWQVIKDYLNRRC